MILIDAHCHLEAKDFPTPAEVIVRVARREGADLIVMGTHGRSGLGRLFMGSVVAHVLGTATCPVLTVRGRGRKA